jgi:type I restriction enzyme S subunit
MKWKEILEIKSGKNQKDVVDINGRYPIYGSGGIIGYSKEYLCPAGTTIIGRKGTIIAHSMLMNHFGMLIQHSD